MTGDDSERDLSRRLFMRETMVGSAATAGAIAASDSAVAQEGGGSGGSENASDGGGNENASDGSGNENASDGGGNENASDGGGGGNQAPAWPDFVANANNFDDGQDARGESEVTVSVGAADGLAFEPAGVWVDTGTTVVWEWTGEGGGHNVNSQDGADFSSDVVSEEGFTFEHTFEESQITTYQCDPHSGQGMHGGVAVGEEIETEEVTESGGGGGTAAVELPDTARAMGVATALAMGSTLGLAYVFMKYGGDYGGERTEE